VGNPQKHIQLFGVEVPNTMMVYPYRELLVITNVADEDSAMATLGFDLILDSMSVP